MRPVVQQVLAAATPHDAVTEQAIAVHELLEGWGYRSEMYAEHVHPELRDLVGRVARRPGDPDAVLLRYSIWSRAVEDVLLMPPRALGMVFHNVTPPELIVDVNAEVAEWCRRGRERVGEVLDRVDLVLADSRYDADDLHAEGFTDVRVVPMLLDLERRQPVPRAPGAPPTILSVGRIVPNKRIEVLIRAFAIYRAMAQPDARLMLIGAWETFDAYHTSLERFVTDLGVGGVSFLGRVASSERDRLYRAADVYVCTSTHEGFCAPLAEAMASGLPVVAIDQAAVPETLAGGGLVVPDGDVCLLAEAIRLVVDDQDLRGEIRAGAETRLRDFDSSRVAQQVHDAVDELLRLGAARR